MSAFFMRKIAIEVLEGWLVKSRDHGLRLPLLKSKWVRRYFVLRCSGNGNFLDEYRAEDRKRLRKSLDLADCVQVDSYLQITSPSCTATRGNDLQWIFSLHLHKKEGEKNAEMYFCSESEQEMLEWVTAICRACQLEKQETIEKELAEEKDIAMPLRSKVNERGMRSDASLLSSSLAGISMSSNISTGESANNLEESSKHNRDYGHINRFHSRRGPRNGQQSAPENRDPRWRNDGSSACSSVSSSRRSLTEDEGTSSCVSSSPSNGKVLMENQRFGFSSSLTHPEPTRIQRSTNNSFSSQDIKPSMRLYHNNPLINRAGHRDNDSSGETIKIIGIKREDTGSTSTSSAPKNYINADLSPYGGAPPVDRSSKPSRIYINSDEESGSLFGSGRKIPSTNMGPKRSRGGYPDAPKSAGYMQSQLEYFEPPPTRTYRRETFSHQPQRPEPVDKDYIQIDAQRTQAIKQLRAQREPRDF
ncbi:unnamed protein product, partial [Mesorhabditis spiculigera]